MLTPLRTSLALVAIALVAAGCGSSTPDIASVGDCLEEAGLTVEAPPTGDADVEEGVFATSAVTGAEAGEDPEASSSEFVFALAAIVPKEESRSRFVEQSAAFAESADDEGKLDFDSGTDGEYVWVAGGEAGAEGVEAARDCVKP
jgi:hypothetical protein